MAYELDAVIGSDEVARSVAFTMGRPAVRLSGDLALVPLDDGHPPLDDERITIALRRASNHGPVARVRAEFFGGVGSQSATIYRNGKIIWDQPMGDVEPEARSPISHALSALGVPSTADGDEFGAVGLGRHRATAEWRREPVIAEYHAS